ncbi:hypothetical protein TWF281_006156 [Arthrobotrys megalospora]
MDLIGISVPTFVDSHDTSESESTISSAEEQSASKDFPQVDVFVNPRKRRSYSDNSMDLSSQKRLRACNLRAQPTNPNFPGPGHSFLNISDDDDDYATDEDQGSTPHPRHNTRPSSGEQIELVYAADEEDIIYQQHNTKASESPSPQHLPDDAIFHDIYSALSDTLGLIMRNADVLRDGGERIIKNASTMKAHAMNLRGQLEMELHCKMRATHQDETACSCGANTPGSILNIWKSQFQGGFLPNGMNFAGLSQTLGKIGQSSKASHNSSKLITIHEDDSSDMAAEDSPIPNTQATLSNTEETRIKLTIHELRYPDDSYSVED